MVEPRVRDCLEELLKFTLESHIKGTLETELDLSNDFCSYLLLNHPKLDTDPPQGETPYPLYKDLALAIHESIISQSNGSEFNEFIVDQSSQLVNIINPIDFELHVQEPFFTQIKQGAKRIEGRCATGDYNRIGPKALILFNKCLVLEVKEVHSYPSFSEMLKTETLEKVLPGVETIEEGVQVYRRFYSEEKEMSNGVIAICLEKMAAQQPYMYLAKLLSELNCKGIQTLLGIDPKS